MNALYLDANFNDAERREALYKGELLVYSPSDITKNFINFADDLIRQSFDHLDPETAQWQLPVSSYVTILKSLKPAFIHHPLSKEFIRLILEEQGCDLEKTYFDVPRLRTSTSNGYLTSGIAYAFHPHRDTWYSAPMSQINWWMPIYDITPKNGMAFHPKYWSKKIKNDSDKFSYQEWIGESRRESAKHVDLDTRWQPKPQERIEMNPDLRIIPKSGGMILFSAAQLHSSIPNESSKTRFSIDFRTVNIDDVQADLGAPNIDTACKDLTLSDFIRASDYAPMPEEIIHQKPIYVQKKAKGRAYGQLISSK